MSLFLLEDHYLEAEDPTDTKKYLKGGEEDLSFYSYGVSH